MRERWPSAGRVRAIAVSPTVHSAIAAHAETWSSLLHCRARRNLNGRVVCANYGKITSLALDPIEKKPLAFFQSGTPILSIGGFGCNLFCPFCQNDSISQHGEGAVSFQCAMPDL